MKFLPSNNKSDIFTCNKYIMIGKNKPLTRCNSTIFNYIYSIYFIEYFRPILEYRTAVNLLWKKVIYINTPVIFFPISFYHYYSMQKYLKIIKFIIV